MELRLIFTRPVSLVGAAIQTIVHRGPGRLRMEWNAELDEVRRKIYYTTLPGDLDIEGQYFVHFRLTLADGSTFFCGGFSFYVFPI